MDPVEHALFTEQFKNLLQQEARQPKQSGPTEEQRFWLDYWAAADASRAYRKRAAEWREAGIDDWADQLEVAADAHDAEWDAKLAARRR